jgi:hypothetical protein
MKICVIIIQAFLSGKPINNSRPLGMTVGISNGLPTIIPVPLRASIRNRHPGHIRTILSYFSAYKALEGTYEPASFATIIAEGATEEQREAIPRGGLVFKGQLERNGEYRSWTSFMEEGLQHIMSSKAGPNGPATYNAFKDAYVWGSLYPDITTSPMYQ